MKLVERVCRLCRVSFLAIQGKGAPVQYCAECRATKWNPKAGRARRPVAA